jgi:hypothetical protein
VSRTALVLGVAAARRSLAELDDFDEIVVLDPSTAELERLVEELADPRLDYLLGGLPVLPLPDGSVDPARRRRSRRPGGRARPPRGRAGPPGRLTGIG